jgi:hypothetical protein
MPLIPHVEDSAVRDWKSDHMVSCSFCLASRKPDPHLVIVSLVNGSHDRAICETCIKGAVVAATREYRRLAERNKTPPSGPNDPKRKRVIKQ